VTGISTSHIRCGVDVKFMVTGIHNNNLLARDNSVRLYGDLLEAGIEIYEFNQTMLHQKYMVCDGIWSTIGTTNFDNRSFAFNDESNVSVYKRTFAAKWEEIFHNDLASCNKIDLKEWHNRSLFIICREWFLSLLRWQV
jgi:cardiolipin synthase